MLKRTTPAGQRIGDLFKASGNNGSEEGPWGRGDGQPLAAELRRPDADLRTARALHRHLRAQDLGLEDRRRPAGADRRPERRPRRRQPERQQHQQRQPGPGAHVPGPELRHRADAGLPGHPQLVRALGRLLPQLLPLPERSRPLVDGALGSGPRVRRELRLERPQVVLHRRAGRSRRPQRRLEPDQGRLHPGLPDRAAGPDGLPGHRRPGQHRSRQGRSCRPDGSRPVIGAAAAGFDASRLERLPGHQPVQLRRREDQHASGSATSGTPPCWTSWPAPAAAAA